MAIQDSVPITTLERAVSTDVVTAQDLINRSIAEAFQSFAKFYDVGDETSFSVDAENIQSGLRMVVSGGTLYLEPGILGQDVSANPPSVPTPDSFDSNYRFGLKIAQEILSDPWDSTTKWWLLQARVVRTTTLSEKRDIYNPTLGTFALSGTNLDKRYESEIEHAWKAGTSTTIPTPDTGYAPIAAVYRPSGGGAISSTQVFQVGTQIKDLMTNHQSINGIAKRTCARLRGGDGRYNPSFDCRFNFAGEVKGRKLFARCSAGIGLRNALFVDPGDIGDISVAGLWWYVYLASPNDMVPAGIFAGIDHRGAIIVSRTKPNDYGTNSGTITAPDPLNLAVPAGEALFVGCFMAGSVAGEVNFIDVADDGVGNCEKLILLLMNQAGSFGNTSSPYNLATLGASGTEIVPYGCHLRLKFRTNQYDTGPAVAFCVGTKVQFGSDAWQNSDEVLLDCQGGVVDRDFHFTPRDGSISMSITSRTLTNTLTASASFPADGGGNEFQVYFVGIRLI